METRDDDNDTSSSRLTVDSEDAYLGKTCIQAGNTLCPTYTKQHQHSVVHQHTLQCSNQPNILPGWYMTGEGETLTRLRCLPHWNWISDPWVGCL